MCMALFENDRFTRIGECILRRKGLNCIKLPKIFDDERHFQVKREEFQQTYYIYTPPQFHRNSGTIKKCTQKYIHIDTFV